MKKYEQLFYLIKSLTKGEKRHFLASRKQPKANYVRLFRAIDKQISYDEKSVKETFAGEQFIRQLHATKNHLRSQIYGSLRSYHNKISADSRVKKLLRTVEILYQKELLVHAAEEIKKAEKLADMYELDLAKVEIARWKRVLLQGRNPNSHTQIVDLLDQEQELFIRAGDNFQQWRFAANAMLASNKDERRSLLNQIHRSDAKNLSVHARVMRAHTVASLALYDGNLDDASTALERAAKEMTQSPEIVSEKPQPFIALLNNLAYLFHIKGERNSAFEILTQAEQVYFSSSAKATSKLLLKEIARTLTIELELYVTVRPPTEYTKRIQFCALFFEDNVAQLPSPYLEQAFFHLGCIYFNLAKYKITITWLNRLHKLEKNGFYRDTQMMGRLLNLMTHCCLNNDIAVTYFATNTLRFLKQHNLSADWNLAIVRMVSRLPGFVGQERSRRFCELRDKLYQSQHDTILPAHVREFLPVRDWLNSQIETSDVY